MTEFKRPRYLPLPPDDIFRLGMSTKDLKARCLFFLCYLTGCRISEGVQFMPGHLSTGNPEFYQVDLIVLKKRKLKGMRRLVPIPRGPLARCHENEMMAQVIDYLQTGNDGKPFPSTEYPFWCWGRGEPYVCSKWKNFKVIPRKVRPNVMEIYLRRRISLTTEAQVRDGERWIRRTIRDKPLHAHFLRHCRASHLNEFYRFDAINLQQFFQWADPRIAGTYTAYSTLTNYFRPRT